MAEVTFTTRFRPNVVGHLRQYSYFVNVAADGDHIDIPVRRLNSATVTDSANTAIGYTASLVNGRTRLLIQTAGAVTGVHVSAWGH